MTASRRPSRLADHAAEVAALELRVLIRKHVGLDVTEGSFRLLDRSPCEGVDNAVLETVSPWMTGANFFPLFGREGVIFQTENVHFDAGRDERNNGPLVLGNARRRPVFGSSMRAMSNGFLTANGPLDSAPAFPSALERHANAPE